MRPSVLGRDIFLAAVFFTFLLFLSGISAHETGPTPSISRLESQLKAKLPATLEQANKDYSEARSIFQRAANHRSKGVDLFTQGWELRRRAVLKAKSLVLSLSQAGLGSDSHAAVRDLQTMMSLAHRIARIASNPKGAPNSAHLLKFLTEAAVRARSRFNSFYHELDGSMLAHPEGHFTQALFHAEMLCARGLMFKALANSEDATATRLKERARGLVLQVKAAQHRIDQLSDKPSPTAGKLISLEQRESARDQHTAVSDYLMQTATKKSADARSSGHYVPADLSMTNSLMSDLRKQDSLEARDERRHLDVDVDFGKAPRDRHTLADSLVKFAQRLSQADSRTTVAASPVQARAPFPLGTDYENDAALQLAQDTAPADQVDLAAKSPLGDSE